MGCEHMPSDGMGKVQSNRSKLAEPDVEAVADHISGLK